MPKLNPPIGRFDYFPFGEVYEVHRIGPYAIVEYVYKDETEFHGYFRDHEDVWHDTNESADTLDRCMLILIAARRLGEVVAFNGRYAGHAARLLHID